MRQNPDSGYFANILHRQNISLYGMSLTAIRRGIWSMSDCSDAERTVILQSLLARLLRVGPPRRAIMFSQQHYHG